MLPIVELDATIDDVGRASLIVVRTFLDLDMGLPSMVIMVVASHCSMKLHT